MEHVTNERQRSDVVMLLQVCLTESTNIKCSRLEEILILLIWLIDEVSKLTEKYIRLIWPSKKSSASGIPFLKVGGKIHDALEGGIYGEPIGPCHLEVYAQTANKTELATLKGSRYVRLWVEWEFTSVRCTSHFIGAVTTVCHSVDGCWTQSLTVNCSPVGVSIANGIALITRNS